MTNRSEAFGRLLKAGISSIVNCEGKKAPIVEDELGQLIGVSGDSIQRYKAGYLPPEPRTVQILAEAAVRRGFLGREWLQRFLHAARYPFADHLLDQLCPIGPARERPPRVYHNLPAPTYSQFIMREQAFADVVDGLRQRSAVVLIVGLGGNGKTSLAREVATRCLQDNEDALRFDAVVWVSDKDRSGTTNLSLVLDEIARTLDYPGFTQFAHDEKLYEVEQLLKRQRILIVVDNFETITDGALLAWLLRMPEPSKAIVTSREYSREYRRGGWPVELRGMTDVEARMLIRERLRVLRIEKLVSDQAQLEPLLVATSGNPKAIEIALGLVKHERRSIQQVVDDLYAARGALFDDLFTRAWALLDEAARRVLLVMSLFPDSASVEALVASADVQGLIFDRVIERLIDLALLDEQRTDVRTAPRYALHPLVRAYALARLHEQPELEAASQTRQATYFLDFANRSIVREIPRERYWNSLLLRDLKDVDREINNLLSVLDWADTQNQYAALVELIMVLSHYLGRRALMQRIHYGTRAARAASVLGWHWEEALLWIDTVGWANIESARFADAERAIAHGLRIAERLSGECANAHELRALAYSFLARIHLAQNHEREASIYLGQALALAQSEVVLHRVLLAAGDLAHHQGDIAGAIRYYKEAIATSQKYGGERPTVEAQYRLGMMYLKQQHLDEAKDLFTEILDAQQQSSTLDITYAQYGLAQVFAASGQIEYARNWAKQALVTLLSLQMNHSLLDQVQALIASLDLQEQINTS